MHLCTYLYIAESVSSLFIFSTYLQGTLETGSTDLMLSFPKS